MDFGQVSDIEKVDFSFPAEHPGNVNILPGFPSKEFSFHVGCPVWAEKSWVGKIYPKGTKEKEYLRFYAEKYSCIELNATHYSIPDLTTIERWKEAVPENFKFCPKVPQSISHAKDMVGMTESMLEFIRVMKNLGKNLGPAFLQLPPYFGPEKIKSLLYFLNALPDDFSLSIEFRHEKWFKEVLKYDKIFNYLEDRRMGTVITDVAGRRDVLHQRLSNRVAFIRFVANDGHPSDFKRMENWSVLLKKWASEGMNEIYFIVHTSENSFSPTLTDFFSEKTNSLFTSQPTFKQKHYGFEQGSLF